MRGTVQTMKLRDLLTAHGISTIAEFRQRADLSKQHAWNLWHGQVNIGLRMARRLEERLGIPYTVFLELERERMGKIAGGMGIPGMPGLPGIG